MKRRLAILCSATVAGFAAGAGAFAADGDPSGDPQSTEIERILSDWAVRETLFPSADIRWRVSRHQRSQSLGTALGREGDVRTGALEVRIRFDGRHFRLDGECQPPVSLGDEGLMTSSLAWGEDVAQRRFRAALRTRFAEPQRAVAPLPYQFLADEEREIHYWSGAGEAYARGILLSAGSAARAAANDSSADNPFPWPLHCGLYEAIRIAVRPSLGGIDSVLSPQARVLPKRVMADGRKCLVVEDRHDGVGENGRGEYWIDVDRRSLVLRCVLRGASDIPRRQYDFEYSASDELPLLPSKITVLQFTKAGNLHDELTVVRQSADLETTFRSDVFSWKPRAGTWVIDVPAGRQYIVKQDGSEREITAGELQAGLTYADLLSNRSWFGAASWEALQIGRSAGRMAVKLFTWPAILITLPAVYAIFLAGRVGLRCVASRGASTVRAPSSSESRRHE